MRVEIRVAGRLPRNWRDWCDGFSSTVLESGETLLVGTLPDQQALVGLLSALCQMNLTLISVRRLESNRRD